MNGDGLLWLFFAVLILIIVTGPGCTTIDPPWSEALETETRILDPATKLKIVEKRRVVRAKAAGLRTTVQKPASDFKTGDVGKIELNGTKVGKTGGGKAHWASSFQAGGPWPYIIGGLAILAGGVIAFGFKRYALGLSLAGAGAVLLFLSYLFAAHSGLVMIVLLVGGAVYLLFFTKRGKAILDSLRSKSQTLDVLVQAGEERGDSYKSEVAKAAAKTGATKVVKATVTESKDRQGLGEPESQ